MRWWMAAMLVLAAPAWGQGVLDVGAVPGLDAAGRRLYGDFLLANTPRVFALDQNGHAGWYSGGTDLPHARERAVALCTEHGGTGCRPYTEDLAVVWPGHAWAPPPPPPAMVETVNYVFEPDSHFLWHGPAQAAGIVVWSHGSTAFGSDTRGLQSPPLLRPFNNAGFDVVRFERSPRVDTAVRAAGWLREQLAAFRKAGYRRVVAAGESRGAWTSLQMLDQAGLADVVLALSPAAHGTFAGAVSSTEGNTAPNLTAQLDDLRQVVEQATPSRSRVAVAQFAADPFAADMDQRTALLAGLRSKEAAVMVIDRPPGLSGHFGWSGQAFADRFSPCLLRFASDPAPPSACP